MVCPFCSTRNNTGSPICSNCGVILRTIKTDKRAPKAGIRRSLIVRSLAIAIAATLGAIVAHKLILSFNDFFHLKYPTLGILIGGVLGATLVYGVSGARFLFYKNLYKFRLRRTQSLIEGSLTKAEDTYSDKLKEEQTSYHARMGLATAHLLHDEVERSVQEFQQAQQLGAGDVQFFNNAGVALAKRGNISQSVEMFRRAAEKNGHTYEPHSNLAHAIERSSYIEDEKVSARALQEVDHTLNNGGSTPSNYNRRGLILSRTGQYEPAIEAFQKALELAGGNKLEQADAMNNIGIARFQSGDTKAAMADFLSALRVDSSHGRALCNLGVLYMLQNRTDEALDLLRKAWSVDPKSAAIRSNYGYALCRIQAVNDGIREFREAYLLDGSLFEPYYNLGKIYADQQIWEHAEQFLMRALKQKRDSWESLAAMAMVQKEQKNYRMAIEYLKEAEKISPEQPLIMTNLGLCLGHAFDYSEGERYLREALAIDNRNASIYGYLGWLHMQQDQTSLAAEELTMALQLNEREPIFNNNYGVCQINLGAYDVALQYLRRALQLDPDMKEAHYNIGYVHACEKRVEMAIKEWEIASKVEHDNIDCHVNLGVAYYQSGKLDEAVTEFRRVIVTRQDKMEDFSNLGLAYAKQGVVLRAACRNPQDMKDARAKQAIEKQKLAIEMFDRALGLDQNNVLLHSNRGLACFFANRPEDAMHEWTTVSRLDPGYARRRGKEMQSAFDESAVSFVNMHVPDRAVELPAKTPDFLYHLATGYDTEEWDMIIEDDILANLPKWNQEWRQLERKLQALYLER